MRATVERDQESSPDPWGGDQSDFQQVATGVPCRVWSRERRDRTDDGKSVVTEDLRAMFPIGADVQEQDQLTQVVDRQGTVLYAGPLAVETISPKRGPGSSPTHLLAMLRRNR